MKWLTFFENLAVLGFDNYIAVVHSPAGENTLTTLVSTDASVIGSLIQGLMAPTATATTPTTVAAVKSAA